MPPVIPADQISHASALELIQSITRTLAELQKRIADTKPDPVPVPAPAPVPSPAPSPAPGPAPPPVQSGPIWGTNLSGMEWAQPGLRTYSVRPNDQYGMPRAADIKWLASTGARRLRLPVQWELLQPVLASSRPNDGTRAIIGQPGALEDRYASYITSVLDAHAAAGITCIIDLHNYCRYRDYRFQPDGSVRGLQRSSNPVAPPFTNDRSQVQDRIFSLAGNTSLPQSDFADLWRRVAEKWKDHPGLGGYGLMNEPHDMPNAGNNVTGWPEDLNIWPQYAKVGIAAIRAVDGKTPIYVSGNSWDSAMTIGTHNPGFPLAGANLIFEVHLYLDANNTGAFFDYDTEVGKKHSAGLGNWAITQETGRQRLKLATDWAKAKGVKLALTEVGMPIDDPRWASMFAQVAALAQETGCEVYSWSTGAHWPIQNYPINHVPGWHQDRTLAPHVSGVLQAAAGIEQATVFDTGPGWSAGGQPVEITVFARGNLLKARVLTVASDKGGQFSTRELLLPPGPNSRTTYRFTPPVNAVCTLSYSGAGQLPPPRKVYSLTDPVGHADWAPVGGAATRSNLLEAAEAILAKYSACRWSLEHGYTDYLGGLPCRDGDTIRAIADTGFGSSPENVMGMLNWISAGPTFGEMRLPIMRTVNGRKCADLTPPNTWGFWCKKFEKRPGVQSAPRGRVPYNLEDPQFAIVQLSVPNPFAIGVAFQALLPERTSISQLDFQASRPRATFLDSKGQRVSIIGADALPPNTRQVVTQTSRQGSQTLRVNGRQVGSANATLAPSEFSALMIGYGFSNYYPAQHFTGSIYTVITGAGVPSAAELAILERALA